jgi:hypothetical protein
MAVKEGYLMEKELSGSAGSPSEILSEERLAELFDADRVEILEKDNGDFLVCVEYSSEGLPFIVRCRATLKGEVVRKYGLVECILVLADRFRRVESRLWKGWVNIDEGSDVENPF